MAWIEIAPEHRHRVEVSEIIRVFSLRPDLMEARQEFGYTMHFGGSGLGRYQEELIAVSISSTLGCKY